jgi:hypothetical protein
MEALNNALSSPRFNRVLLWFSALVLALGVGLVVNNLAGGSDDKAAYSPERGFKPQLPVKENPLTNAQGVKVKSFEPLDPQMRSAIRTFLATAVVRKDLDKSWDVVAPTMKQGFTFAQWKSGGGRDGLPVIPYPIDNVDTAQYHLFYATDHEILVDVGLSAKNRAQRPRRFRLGMEPFGSGPRRQWLVSYWMPLWTPLLPIN